MRAYGSRHPGAAPVWHAQADGAAWRVPLWADELPDGSQVIAAPSATVQKLWWPPSMSSPARSVHMGRSCASARRAGAAACWLKPRFPTCHVL